MTYLTYFIYVNVYILIFWVFYKLLLQNEHQFNLNRLYLILSITIPFALPFLHNYISTFRFAVVSSNAPLATLNFNVILDAVNITAKSNAKTVNWLQYSQLLLAIGSCITLLYTIVGHLRIKSILRGAEIEKKENQKLFLCPSPIIPFSYNRNIVIPKSTPENERDVIIFHESLHIAYFHYLDTYLIQIFQILLWFNPIFYLLKNELKQVHEFQVDKHILNSGIDAITYKLTLVKFSVGSHKFQLANGLTNCPIKKRLIMMNKLNPKRNIWKYLFALPTLALTAIFFSAPSLVTAKPTPVVPKTIETVATDSSKVIDTNEQVFQVVEVMPQFPGGNKALMKYLGDNLKYPTKAQEKGTQGRVFIGFIISKDGSVTNVKITRSLALKSNKDVIDVVAEKSSTNNSAETDNGDTKALLENEALRIVKSMPKWEPGVQRGKKVNVSYVLPINFSLK